MQLLFEGGDYSRAVSNRRNTVIHSAIQDVNLGVKSPMYNCLAKCLSAETSEQSKDSHHGLQDVIAETNNLFKENKLICMVCSVSAAVGIVHICCAW